MEAGKHEVKEYSHKEYYCVDGFPKEGLPCVIVVPAPYRLNHVYQGIKPSVLIIDAD